MAGDKKLKGRAGTKHRVVVMPVSSLKGWDRNPRTISDDALAGLGRSLDRWGVVQFPVWNERTKNLVGGHQRIKALRKLGVAETQVVVIDVSEDEEKFLNLALNNPEIEGEFTTGALDLLAELRGKDKQLHDMLQLDQLDEYLKAYFEEELLEQKRETSKPESNGVTIADDASAAQAAEPKAGEEFYGEYVPDIAFPSDNDFGIPTLDPKLQVESVVRPIVRWGYIARTNDRVGFVHFYTDDYRFRALWEKPNQLLKSNTRGACEPNFTTTSDLPRAYNLYAIYKKRWLARYWQSKGIPIAVDLFVGSGDQLSKDNMLGVPKGWRSYSTKITAKRARDILDADAPPESHAHFALACKHAGTRDILFLIAGGGQAGEALCKKFGWIFLERLDADEEQEN